MSKPQMLFACNFCARKFVRSLPRSLEVKCPFCHETDVDVFRHDQTRIALEACKQRVKEYIRAARADMRAES
jgi:ribosomal protein S27E